MTTDLPAKDRRIKREKTKLRRLFKDIPAETRPGANELIDSTAFLAVILADLEQHLNLHGCFGGAHKTRTPETKLYLALLPQYRGNLRLLLQLEQTAAKPEAQKDSLLEWVKGA